MTTDTISIIIPCYNAERYLEDCIKSIENQTYKNFEAIFINDGSKDGTLKILQDAFKKNEKFKIIDQKNAGVSAARNNGVASAQGDFVCFVDADDMIAPNYLQQLISVQRETDADVVCCKYSHINKNFKNENIKNKKNAEKIQIFEEKSEILSKFLTNKKFCYVVWNKLYRKTLLEKLDEYPNLLESKIAYGEDLEFNFRCLLKCNKVAYVSQSLYFYRILRNSAVRGKFKERLLSVFDAHNKCMENSKEFAQLQPYIRANICVSCVEMLFRMSKAKYENSEVIREVYSQMLENKKYLLTSKGQQWFKRLIPLSRPILRMKLAKHLKRKKK